MARMAHAGALPTALLAAGCTSDQQYLQSGQSAATTTTLERGRFELNCPAATSCAMMEQATAMPRG